MSRARELSRLGNPNIIKADSDFNVGFGTLTPRAKGDFVGVVSATSFYGDGSTLTGVAAAGIGTALSDEKTSPLNSLFYTNQSVRVGTSTEFNPPTSGNLGYSQAAEVEVADGADFTVGDGDVFMVDVLGITTDPLIGASVDNNYLFSTIYADNITNQAGTGAPDASQGFKISKTTESTNSLTGALIVSGGVGIAKSLHVGGNVSVGGTLTYEDVTNQDVLGIATYRSGVKFGVAGVGGTITATGNATFAGIVTASGFKGSGANLTALNADNISSGIVTSARLGGGSATSSTFLRGDGQFASPSGGPWKLLETSATPNDTASLTFTISSYTDYPIIRLIAPRIVTAAASANYAVPNLRIIQSGSTVTAANYNNGYIAANALPGLPNGGGTQKENKTSFYLGVYDAPLNYFQIDLVNPHSTTSTVDFPSITGWTEAKDHQGLSGNPWSQRANWTGHYDGSGSDTVAVTGVVIYMGNLAGTAKNMESGSLPIKMYGLDGY